MNLHKSELVVDVRSSAIVEEKKESYEAHELIIKNMICSRCLKVIREDIESLGVELLELTLGKVKIRFPKGKTTLRKIEEKLLIDNFKIAKNSESAISELIKIELISIINDLPIVRSNNLSQEISKNLKRDYFFLSKTFSNYEGITIEQYFIKLRIEKAKELINYGEFNFSQISFDLGYKNIAHLSRQFKQHTKMSMSEYKKQKEDLRIPLDKIV